MKAYVYREYGGPDKVHLEDVPTPTPRRGEILVKVHATTVTAADWRALTLEMPPGFGAMGRLVFGLTRPRKPILGMEFAGVVERVGEGAARFREGDEVFGSTGGRMGAHAEHVAIAEGAHLARKPAGISFEEAAALSFGPSTALYFLDKAHVAPGERVLVIGASGGVGTATVQLAKHRGAHVTGVTSAPNAELVRSLGADRVVDYAVEDALAEREAYDVIVDTVEGTDFRRARDALRPGGRFAVVSGKLGDVIGAPFTSKKGRTLVTGVAKEGRAVAERIAALAGEGAIRPTIDHVYAFREMREAHARVASRRKRGNVVVRVGEDG